MTELSGFWTTTGTASGHQQASYTQAQWSTAAKILGDCSGFEGVAPFFGSNMGCSSPGVNQVDVTSGAAIVDGKWYHNDATINLDSGDFASPSAGTTRIDRIVLRCTWASFTVAVTVITGVESAGTPTAPSITQTSGTTYDIMLYQVLIDDTGAITLTDERDWAIVYVDNSTIEAPGQVRVKDGGITAAKLASDAVTTVKILNENVTAAKIANRSRRFICEAVGLQNAGGVETERIDFAGWRSEDGLVSTAYGEFACPMDYASGMTAKAIYQPAATGNAYVKNEARYGSSGEAYSNHTANDGGYAAQAVTNAQLFIGQSMSLSSVATGDIVTLTWYRDSSNASDTLSAYVYFKGWLIEYTADS